jgi:hypothetical protein
MPVRQSLASIAFVGTFMLATNASWAISLPDSGSCSSNGAGCLGIANTNSVGSAIQAESGDLGVDAYGDSVGVIGHSQHGLGVYAVTTAFLPTHHQQAPRLFLRCRQAAAASRTGEPAAS